MPPQKNDILQGTLALLVLKTVAANRWMHGYAITTHIQRVSADLLRVEEGSLYPALHRMEQHGWLKAEWDVTEKNREARFYAPMPAGRKQHAAEKREWNHMVITSKGDRLTVALNGEEVITNAQLPGIPARGPIALQNHGQAIQFKNLYVKELK